MFDIWSMYKILFFFYFFYPYNYNFKDFQSNAKWIWDLFWKVDNVMRENARFTLALLLVYQLNFNKYKSHIDLPINSSHSRNFLQMIKAMYISNALQRILLVNLQFRRDSRSVWPGLVLVFNLWKRDSVILISVILIGIFESSSPGLFFVGHFMEKETQREII